MSDSKKTAVISDVRGTRVVSLEEVYPNAEVVIWDSFLMSQYDEKIEKLTKDANPSNLVKALPSLIKEWNLVDTEGNELPITEESLRKLDVRAIAILGEEMADAFKGKKKDSATSP